MKKLFSIFVITLISLVILPFSVNAANITTLEVNNNNGKLTVSGTTESGVYAVAVLVYSGDNLVHMETCSNDEGYSCKLNKKFSEGTYTVKVADYDGGTYITKDVAVVLSNPQTGDSILSSVIICGISFISLIICLLYINKRKIINA